MASACAKIGQMINGHLRAAQEGILLGGLGGMVASVITAATPLFKGGLFGASFGGLGMIFERQIRSAKPEWAGFRSILVAEAIALPSAVLALQAVGAAITPWAALQIGVATHIGVPLGMAMLQELSCALST